MRTAAPTFKQYKGLRLPNLTDVRIERMLRHMHCTTPIKTPWLIPDKMRELFTPTHVNGVPIRYRVCYGGRGAGRSWGFARNLLVRAVRKELRILCAREFQNSIEESIHQLLSDQIELLGLKNFFIVKQRTIEVYNGSEFIFQGLKTNVTKLKSLEGVDICYIEEAEKISSRSWEVLTPTIRKEGSEIWASFNADLEKDPTFKKFITSPPPNALVIKSTFADNPWFTDTLDADRKHMQRVDLDAYMHVWEGETRKNSVAQILRNKYVVQTFSPYEFIDGKQTVKKGWNGPYFGADWGFSQDPTTLVKCWIYELTLYIEYEAYKIGCDLDKTPELFDTVPGAREHTIRADSARPETISHMRNHGYDEMVGVEKWSGSVEDGIAHLRSYEQIVIHTRCEHAQEEVILYSYKIDKLSGDVLSEVQDKHNHIIDAIRYALAPMIKQGGAEMYLQYLRESNNKDAEIKAKQKELEPKTNHFVEYYKLNGAK
jgi:phage terminase large subunit